MNLDPRSVANLILEEAACRGISITNLSLQKILYFVHGKFLVETGEPLISGHFEAWKYGPVNIAVYDCFKSFISNPINTLSCRKNLRTGEIEIVPAPECENLRREIRDAAAPYLKMSAGRLVDLSHAKLSPWDKITKTDSSDRIFGMKITNDNIKQNFRYHKVTIHALPSAGEPYEESPPY